MVNLCPGSGGPAEPWTAPRTRGPSGEEAFFVLDPPPMASRTDTHLPPDPDPEATLSRPPEPARSGGPALQRIAVVVNGNAKSVTAEVIETLDQILDSGDLFVSRSVEESEGIARILVDRGYETILTGGGDGTFTVVVTSVVNEAKRRNAPLPRFGLLRLGTGNSLAWVLGASGAGEKGSGGFRGLVRRLAFHDGPAHGLHMARARALRGARAWDLRPGVVSPCSRAYLCWRWLPWAAAEARRHAPPRLRSRPRSPRTPW